MSQYLLSIDQGTTSTRAMLFDTKGQFVAVEQQELSQSYPQEGWVEHDPQEIWHCVVDVVKKVLQKMSAQASDVIGIGITNQRETTVLWDQQTGEPVYPAIVWQDRRTAKTCEGLRQTTIHGKPATEVVQQRSGLVLDPYFSATKIHWILDNVPQAQQLHQQGRLKAGTIDTYLIWKMTNGERHVTDATNACRTNLFHLQKQVWDETLCDFFQVPMDILPEVLDCAADFGQCHADHFGAQIPIAGVAGDQHAALVGQACFQPGMSKCTYGTGCFLVLNTGAEIVPSNNGLLTTMAYRLKGKPTFAMEGSAFIAGAVVQWLRDGLQLFANASDSLHMAVAAKPSPIVFVPAFTGLGAPYWDPNARAAIFGMTRDTGRNEIVAAALESVCFQTMDLLKAMSMDGAQTQALRVDGGMTANDHAMQVMANLAQTKVVKPAMTETTALGAAYLAGLQLGVFSSLDDVTQLWQQGAIFEVSADHQWSDDRYAVWQKAVKACQLFAEEG